MEEDPAASSPTRLTATCSILDRVVECLTEELDLQFAEVFEGQYNVVFLDDLPKIGFSAFNMIVCRFLPLFSTL